MPTEKFVSTDHFWCWGIDVAIDRLAIGFVDDKTGGFESMVIEYGLGTNRRRHMSIGEQLEVAYNETTKWAKVARGKYPPATIALEVPRGSFYQTELLMVAGIVCQVLTMTTSLRAWDMNTSTWKRIWNEAGFNLAKKERLLPVMASIGWETIDEDQAAAVAIAGAARQVYYEGAIKDLHPIRVTV